MIDNFVFNSVLLCDISITVHFKIFFFASCALACFSSCLFYANVLFLFRVWDFQIWSFIHGDRYQLWRTRIGIYDSNQLHQSNNLKTNPTHFVLNFLNFYMTAVCLIPLTYFSVYLILAPVRNYGFNVNRFNITNALLIKYFDFAAMSLILLRSCWL